MLWEDWYRQLEQLSADATEWDQLDEFLDRVRLLGCDRNRERSAGIGDALRRLHHDYGADVAYFDFDKIAAWVEDGVAFLQHAAARDALTSLAEQFDALRRLRDQPATTLAGERLRREAVAALENAAIQLYGELISLVKPRAVDSDAMVSDPDGAPHVSSGSTLLNSSPAEPFQQRDEHDALSMASITKLPEKPLPNFFNSGRAARTREDTLRELLQDSPLPFSDLSNRNLVARRACEGRNDYPDELDRISELAEELSMRPINYRTEEMALAAQPEESPKAPDVPVLQTQPSVPMTVAEDSLTSPASARQRPEVLGASKSTPADSTAVPAADTATPINPCEEGDEPQQGLSHQPQIRVVSKNCTGMAVREIALAAMESKESARIEYLPPLIWKLISDGRHGLAFHLATSVEASHADTVWQPPSWLISAVALGMHVRHADGELAQRLRDDLGSHGGADYFRPHDESWNRCIRLLLAAASMRTALLAPTTTNAPEVLASLHMREGLTRFFNYCQRIAVFGQSRQPLDAISLKKAKDQAVWRQELLELQREVEEWCAQAPRMSILYQAATNVWRKWQEPGQLMHRLLQPVREHNVRRREFVQDEVRRLADAASVRVDIQHTDRTLLRRNGGDEIDGKAVGQIQSRVRLAVAFSRRWLELVDCEPQQGRDFLQRAADNLRQTIRAEQSEVLDELKQYAGDGSDVPLAAGVACCLAAVDDLGKLFDPSVPLPLKEPLTRHLLHAELLKIPSLALNERWSPSQPDSPQTVESILRLLAGEDVDWGRAYGAQCEVRNHEATARILEVLRENGHRDVDPDALEQDRQQRLQSCRDALRRDNRGKLKEIEHAVALGLLDERERSNHDAWIVSIERDCDAAIEFGPLHSLLAGISEEIAQKQAAEVAVVSRRLQDLALREDAPWVQRIESCLKHGDVLTANEYIDMATREEPVEDLETSVDRFQELFSEGLRMLGDFLDATQPPEVQKKVRERTDFAGISFKSVPGAQSDQALDMITAWYLAKRQPTSIKPEHVDRIVRGLGWLPFKFTVRAGGPPCWVDIETKPISDRNQCPVAVYGSSARGRYRVMCVWNRPSEDELLNQMGGVNPSLPVIVFHFGRMSEKRRRDLARLCRTESKTLIVLDDALIVWLCGQRGSRSPAFFECGLPFTHLVPYADTAGLVPTEMFYGRRRERVSIASPTGSCFIFGGRQLGKTALLRDVERTVHAPQDGQLAIWLDLRVSGIGYDRDVVDLWNLIAGRFKGLGVIPENTPTHISADRLLEHVEGWLNANGLRRILLLLDEADRFLEHDGKLEFIHSGRLKGLMDRTDRRFKVVFAGLHNVQRTTRQSNHPLAHYQEPICIGPLLNDGEWREARELIERPLGSLGYRFESPDLVTRILSQTNYYPSLIQLYCKELLKHVTNPKVEMFDPRTTPPYLITAKHVEGAYQSQDLRSTIRQKLSLTLQLDPRYEVIAYALASHFLCADAGALVTGMPVSWIRRQALSWWEEGFRDANSDDLIRVLSDEMVGLGVLRLVGNDCYTFRSPNVISLLGNEGEILSELCRHREPPPEFEAATFRSTYQDKTVAGGLWRSPLTAEQQAELRSRENGAFVLFGCNAAGLDDLLAALPVAVSQEFFVCVTETEDLNAFRTRLKDLDSRTNDGTTLVLVSPDCAWDQHWVQESLDRAERLTSTTAFVRFLFVADAAKAWKLISPEDVSLLLPKSPRLRTGSLRPWHDAAIRQWLEDAHLPGGKPQRDRIYQATGNWSSLLRQLYARSHGDATHFDSHIKAIAESFAAIPWAEECGRLLGLCHSTPREVLSTLAALQPASCEELVEVLEGVTLSDVQRSLRWADLLSLAVQKKDNKWEVDRVVGRILEAIHR